MSGAGRTWHGNPGGGKPMNRSAANCYGIRRLNPFLGVVQVAETDDARALSVDGVNWQLQVLAERPEHIWATPNRGKPRRQFFRFGMWQPDAGMTRVPVNPVLDFGAMLTAADALVEILERVHLELPFALHDRFELWLLDPERRPLALLGSAVNKRFMAEVDEHQWHAALPGGEPFRAPSLLAQGIPAQDMTSRRRHADRLEQLVRHSVARPPAPQWIERADDGGGTALDSSGEVWPATAFPCTGLRTDWPDAQDSALVGDYLDWLAPRLLALPGLPPALRRHLEQAAARQALLVEANYRLYPEILDGKAIAAARVEARLRQAATAT